MAQPETFAEVHAPRTRRSGAERLAEQLGGEAQLRKFEAKIADALELGGATRIELDSRPGSGLVIANRLLHGGPIL